MIDGEKAFITNSGTPITSLVTITALTGPGEISTIASFRDAWLRGAPAVPQYGLARVSDTHGLSFVECRVPEDHLLGPRGRGFAQFLEILDEGRIAIAALAIGCCSDASTTRSPTPTSARRSAGRSGRPGGRLSLRRHAGRPRRVVRRLAYHAAWLHDTGRPFKTEAAVAKLFATEAAVDATRSATQVFGGYGFMDPTPVSRHYRDAKILEIGEGTSEVQRLVISRALGLRVCDLAHCRP